MSPFLCDGKSLNITYAQIISNTIYTYHIIRERLMKLFRKSSKDNNVDYYSEQRISNSSLGWFKVSPKYYKMKVEREIEEESKTYFDLGRQIHMSILEPNRFKNEFTHLTYETPSSPQQTAFCQRFVGIKKRMTVKEKSRLAYKQIYTVKNKSDEKIQKEADALYNKLKNYIKYLKQSEKYRVVLPTSTWETIQNLITVSKEHKLANTLLFQNDYGIFDDGNLLVNNELPIYWDFALDEDIILSCKSLLDRLIIDHKNKVIKLIDLKTAYSLKDFGTHFTEFGYHRQLAFYWLAVAWMFQNDFPEADFWEYQKQTFIVALQTKGVAECRVYTITDKLLNDGLEEILQLSKEVSWHIDHDLWEHSRKYYEGDGAEKLE
jgi:hypothetical protein